MSTTHSDSDSRISSMDDAQMNGAQMNGTPSSTSEDTQAKIRTARKVLSLLTPVERRRGLLVMALATVTAVLESIGVASVLPFMAVLGNPAMVREDPWLAWLYTWSGFSSTNSFLFALGVAAFCLIIVSAVVRSVTVFVMHRYTQMRSHSIGLRLLQGYVRQPYTFFLYRNSADLAKSILSETQQLLFNIFRPAMQVIVHIPIAIGLVVLLVVVEPVITLVAAGGMSVIYGAIYSGVRAVLLRIGQERLAANQARFTAVNELLGGIKELKVLGRESGFVAHFQRSSERFSRHQASSQSLMEAPKYGVEAVAFGGILGLTLVLMGTRQDLGEVLPVLGLYAFAGLRLLPAVQRIYAGFSSLRYGLPALDSVYRDLELGRTARPSETATQAPMLLKKSIRYEGVSFHYPEADAPVLHDLDLEIPINTTVALVGSTGSGKTTAVDLLLGLLSPTAGRILIDDTPLTPENARAWQARLGYVPQSIFLADASVAENIAFGVDPAAIDQAAVEEAAQIANIHDFIMSELPKGYTTLVGERGVRISGGQRQRIGIARALYHNPDVLVLDEATSALDNATEAVVMGAIRKLSGQKTIVMIAHRLSTVQAADSVVLLERGRVKGKGSYDELLNSEQAFRELAAIG